VPSIVICSLEVLSLFKQEFDFFDIKHDCVQSTPRPTPPATPSIQ
jgi:hypothetical protein